MRIIDQIHDAIDVITAEEYERGRDEFMSAHKLADYMRCQHLFKALHVTKEERIESSQKMHIGTLLHCSVLEPEEYSELYAIGGPINPKTGKEYGQETKKWKDAEEKLGREIISLAESEEINAMTEAVYEDKNASRILEVCTEREVAIRCNLENMQFQGRPDAYGIIDGSLVLCDLKTCKSLDFMFDLCERFYGTQLAVYSLMLEQCKQLIGEFKRIEPVIIAVEKRNAPRVGIFQMTQQTLDENKRKIKDAIKSLKESLRNDRFEHAYKSPRFF